LPSQVIALIAIFRIFLIFSRKTFGNDAALTVIPHLAGILRPACRTLMMQEGIFFRTAVFNN